MNFGCDMVSHMPTKEDTIIINRSEGRCLVMLKTIHLMLRNFKLVYVFNIILI